MKKTILALAVALSMPMATAQAAPPPSGPVIGDPSCSLATSMTSITGYIGCFGSISDSPPIQNEGLVSYLDANFSGYSDWTYLGESSAFASNAFKADYNSGTTGTIEFDSPLTGIYGIGVKTSTSSSVYVYNFTGVSSIAFTTAGTGLNNQGIPQGISHAMLYSGEGGDINCTPGGSCCLTNPTGPGCQPVPEPASFGLVFAGLAGLGAVARRRRNRA